MNDIFGYNRNIQNNAILSSDNVVLDFGNGKVSLIQGAELTYGHKISPVFEAGSADIYFVNGGANGALSVTSIVGRQGFFDGFELGIQACGNLSTFSLTALDNNECGFTLEKNNAIRLEGVLLERISLNFRAGEFIVGQGANFVVGKVITTKSTSNN